MTFLTIEARMRTLAAVNSNALRYSYYYGYDS